jgi:hypothetical protein
VNQRQKVNQVKRYNHFTRIEGTSNHPLIGLKNEDHP